MERDEAKMLADGFPQSRNIFIIFFTIEVVWAYGTKKKKKKLINTEEYKAECKKTPSCSLSVTFLPTSYKDLGLRWVHLDNPHSSPGLKIINLITAAKLLLTDKVTYSRVLGIRA